MNILKPFMALCLMQALPCTVRAAQPDSVYVFPYPTTNDHGRRGMQFVWSADGKHWQDVAEGMVFMRCDFGAWKYMYKPRLIQDRQDGRLHCFWDLDPEGSAIGYASSADLVKWTPQEYFMGTEQGKFAVKDGRMPVTDTVQIGDKTIAGYALKVSYGILEGMERHGIYRSALNAQRGERAEHDAARFAGLQTVNARITVDEGRAKPISENLIGVFFEDLNYAADGGLYAELVQNRDSNTPKPTATRTGTGTVATRGAWRARAWHSTCLRISPSIPTIPITPCSTWRSPAAASRIRDSTASR